MIVSQSSESREDPFSDFLSVAGARSVRLTRLEAAGRWGLRFAVRPRLKFVAVVSGSCQLRLPGCAPETVARGSVLLIGRTAYGIASGPGSAEEDGDDLFRDDARTVVRLGGDETVLLGGGLDVEATFADLLLDALPPVMRIAPAKGSVVALLLGLLETEAGSGRMGEALVTSRLSDLLLVEAIRTYAADPVTAARGWIGALADARIGTTLRLMHAQPAERWTVSALARAAGMSRSSYADRFAGRVGQPPLDYLTRWRMLLARRRILAGDGDIGGIARDVGYASPSAFAHAYRRTFGHTPRQTPSADRPATV